MQKYSDFITACRAEENRLQLYHVHHIVPRYKGGSNDEDNLIKLSVKNHAIAHILLAYEDDYVKNIRAANLILYGVQDRTHDVEQLISTTEDDEHIRMLENWLEPVYYFRWPNRKPLRITKGLALKRGYDYIKVCPVCSKSLGFDEWCHKDCYAKWAEKHKEEIVELRREGMIAAQSKRDKIDIARKSSLTQKGNPRHKQWITNDVDNRLQDVLENIPKGWHRGRTRPKGYKEKCYHNRARRDRLRCGLDEKFRITNSTIDIYVLEEDINHYILEGWQVLPFFVNDGVHTEKIDYLMWPWYKAHNYYKGKAPKYDGNVFQITNEIDVRYAKEEDLDDYLRQGFDFLCKTIWVHKDGERAVIAVEDWPEYKKKGYEIGMGKY